MAIPGTVRRPDGVELAYEDTGGDGPVVLLTPGFTGTLRSWDPTVGALAAAGWRVVTWDVRGHGETITPPDPELYRLDLVVDDLAALLDHLGSERAVVGGLSFGGYLALAFWCRYPERVRALLLADTGPGFRNPTARDGWNKIAFARADDIEARGRAALLDRPSGSATTAASQAAMGFERHRDVDALARAVRGFLAQFDGRVMEAIDGVDVPALILVGADDEPFLPASKVMANKLRHSSLVVLDGAGHIANVDQPAAFNDAAVAFLRQLV
jgi:pimeloyl-ACP methyl ester carboxylesterase